MTKDQNPLWTMIIVDIVGTIVVFLFSWRFDNTSVYDPYWSFAPVTKVKVAA